MVLCIGGCIKYKQILKIYNMNKLKIINRLDLVIFLNVISV